MSNDVKNLVCIVCPTGCKIRAFYKGEELQLEGNQCKKGAEYAFGELTNPVRMLTTTVSLDGEQSKRLSVRTTGPINKEYLLPAMEIIKNITIKAPVKRGQVILSNLCDTGVDVIASCDAR